MPSLKNKVNFINKNKLLWILSGQLYQAPVNSFLNFYTDYKINKNNYIFRTKLINQYSGFVNFINQKTLEANSFANKIYLNTTSKGALEFLTNLETSSTEQFDIFPQIIFIDINMPMIDGFQFIETLKIKFSKRFKSIKIVILTSSLSIHDREKSMSISKDILFLNKPLTKEALNQI
jgi:CheY-like chemotaxis protein